jgi:tRNA (cmo5U34)-methyltransferase
VDETSREFFDEISGDYASAIERCVPRYREMLWAMLYYLPAAWAPGRVLELGCGSGNLSAALCEQFPDASIRLVDFSGKLLRQCERRLAGHRDVCCQQDDFRDLRYPDGSFDLVASSIAIHHLADEEKAELFKRVHRWLSSDGVFTYCDQFAGATEDLYAKHLAKWRECATGLGASKEEWDAWMQHQEAHDFHAPLLAQVVWLREAGFAAVDCPWRFLLWTVLQARKR